MTPQEISELATIVNRFEVQRQAARQAADLARLTAELEKEKKKNQASKAPTPSSVSSPAAANAVTKTKKSAAAIRKQQVL